MHIQPKGNKFTAGNDFQSYCTNQKSNPTSNIFPWPSYPFCLLFNMRIHSIRSPCITTVLHPPIKIGHLIFFHFIPYYRMSSSTQNIAPKISKKTKRIYTNWTGSGERDSPNHHHCNNHRSTTTATTTPTHHQKQPPPQQLKKKKKHHRS